MSGRPGRGVVRLANWSLALGSLAIFAGLAEATARLVDLRPRLGQAVVNPAWLGNRWLGRSDYLERLAQAGLLRRYYDLYQWNRFLVYSLRPNRELELIDPLAPAAIHERTKWTARTNSRGFRTPEFEIARTPGRRRVVTLGDSSTFGWGVEVEDAYPERLRRELAARRDLDPESVEVINLGVPGYSTFQGRVQLELVGLPLQPDVVVWSYLANDGTATGESDHRTLERRLGWEGALLEFLHRSAAYEALEAWVRAARSRLQPPEEPDASDPAARNVANYGEAARNIRDAVLLARQAGVPMVLLAQCVRREVSGVLFQAAERVNAPLLDATALLDASLEAVATDPEFAAQRALLADRYGEHTLRTNPHLVVFLPDNCHPNAIGHQLVAEALADLIEKQWGEAPRP